MRFRYYRGRSYRRAFTDKPLMDNTYVSESVSVLVFVKRTTGAKLCSTAERIDELLTIGELDSLAGS